VGIEQTTRKHKADEGMRGTVKTAAKRKRCALEKKGIILPFNQGEKIGRGKGKEIRREPRTNRFSL
jgi:hypothetical protein